MNHQSREIKSCFRRIIHSINVRLVFVSLVGSVLRLTQRCASTPHGCPMPVSTPLTNCDGRRYENDSQSIIINRLIHSDTFNFKIIRLQVKMIMETVIVLVFLVFQQSHGFCLTSTRSSRNYQYAPRTPLLSMSVSSKVKTSRRKSIRDKVRLSSERKSPTGSVLLNFVGSKRVISEPIPVVNTQHHMNSLLTDYFKQDRYRDLLFPKNNATVYREPLTSDMFDTWCNQAELCGFSGPNVVETIYGSLELVNTKDEVASVIKISVNLQFPGLKIISESFIGVKLLLSNPLPEYQFTLLKSNLIPEGNAAVMWTFNQIMKYRDSTSSFTRVSVECNQNSIVFVTDARLGTSITIPAGIMQLLPMFDVEKYEKQGSNAIQKLLEKDLLPALNSFAESFRTYLGSVTFAP